MSRVEAPYHMAEWCFYTATWLFAEHVCLCANDRYCIWLDDTTVCTVCGTRSVRTQGQVGVCEAHRLLHRLDIYVCPPNVRSMFCDDANTAPTDPPRNYQEAART